MRLEIKRKDRDMLLGILGRLMWLRCVSCGMDFNLDCETDEAEVGSCTCPACGSDVEW
jgi:DNA-directed RNA polymerase subunit RPC12/RpoP